MMKNTYKFGENYLKCGLYRHKLYKRKELCSVPLYICTGDYTHHELMSMGA